ncbi:MAG TPA: HAMP domain-containing histidine kinase, partial [Epsilonproteobacteria bacterium]|nr:HAMP domain-containing histidine kinase [Campylobacterota bacterium]
VLFRSGFFLIISLVFLISIIIAFFFIRENNLEKNATDSANLATSFIIQYIKVAQAKTEEIVTILASTAATEFNNTTENDGVIASILDAGKRNNLNIVGGGIWFEPYAVDKKLKDFLLFYNRNGNNQLELVDNYTEGSKTHYRDMSFYKLARSLPSGTVAWTNVYVDPVTKVNMITAVAPIYREQTFIGVASVDIKIGQKDKAFWKHLEAHNIYVMMIDKDGNFIGKSNKIQAYISTNNIYTIKDIKIQKIIKKIQPVLTHRIQHTHKSKDELLNKIYLIEDDPIFHQESVVAVYHFHDTHWSIIVGILKEQVMAQSNQTFKTVLILIIVLTLLATILGYLVLQKLFVSPIESINRELKNSLSEDGQQYTLLTCHDKGEIGALVNNLNARTVTLAETKAREADEIAKRLKNEKMLVQQSKMAAMGEMMDAVAHQWKQPLNALSMYAEIIKGDYEEGNIDQAYIDQFRDDIQLQIDHMVNTLDEFRTFFRPNKEDENFQLLAVINSVLILTKDDLLKNRITVSIDQSDPIFIDGSANEFKHLVLNILTNAKDAFRDNNIEKRKISIRLIKDEQGKRLEIEDNAGGIPDEIINDIFKSHITTK